MIDWSNLGEIFGLFSSGLGIGVILISLFFVIGSAIAFLYSIMTKA